MATLGALSTLLKVGKRGVVESFLAAGGFHMVCATMEKKNIMDPMLQARS